MEKINVVIKDKLFKKIGLVVEKCSAHTDETDDYVRIWGIIIKKEEWEENFILKVKANLYDNDDDIIHIDSNTDDITFDEIGYESFNIYSFKDKADIKYVEIYPQLIKRDNYRN